MFQHEKYIKLTNLISETVTAEKIFLLAITKVQYEIQGVFIGDTAKPVKSTHFHVLVLVPNKLFNNYNTCQEKIESACYGLGLVTPIVMSMLQFNEWLKKGHPFAVPVKEGAVLIYDKEDILLAEHKPIDIAYTIEESSIVYMEGIERMQMLIRKNKLRAAAVLGLQTIIKAGMGLTIKTNDLDKLTRYASLLIKEIPAFFPTTGFDLKHFSRKLIALLRLTSHTDIQI